jgi:putative SOS response-associated peptidase YedK
VRPKDRAPLAFAGLWETWMGRNGEEMETAAIVTTAANRALAPLHDRMPVVIPEPAFDLWLDCARVDALTASTMLVPAPEALLEAYEVSPAVNRTANDGPELIAPALAVAPEPPPAPRKPRRATDERQPSLFDDL